MGRFSKRESRQLASLYGVVALLHLLGWGLYLHFAARHPALVGLGFAAYLLGLRHGFDADHIAAIDDSVRYLLQNGKPTLSAGLFFSLGHSTLVLALALAVGLAATAVKRHLPQLQSVGGLIGVGVSGVFLIVIGLLNFLVLLDILGLLRQSQEHSHAHLDALLARRGLLNRLFRGRLQNVLKASWQMYPLGILFGFGFDTASEIAMLAITAGASAGDLPVAAVLALPVLFAAGMTLLDTTDGLLMSKAYDWALVNPVRRVFFNLTTTGFSVGVALVIGSIEVLQLVIGLLHLRGGLVDWVRQLDFGRLGYIVVAIFLLAWGASFIVWRLRRSEDPPGALARLSVMD